MVKLETAIREQRRKNFEACNMIHYVIVRRLGELKVVRASNVLAGETVIRN